MRWPVLIFMMVFFLFWSTYYVASWLGPYLMILLFASFVFMVVYEGFRGPKKFRLYWLIGGGIILIAVGWMFWVVLGAQ